MIAENRWGERLNKYNHFTNGKQQNREADMSTVQGFPVAEACRVAAIAFGIDAPVELAKSLPSYEDANVRLTARDSHQQYVLKVANINESESALDFQNCAMAWLVAKGCTAPRVLPTLHGESMLRLQDGPGEGRLARMVEYLPGVPLAEVQPQGEDVLQGLGTRLAEMAAAFEGFAHPGMHRTFDWDLARADPVVRKCLADLADPAQVAMVEQILALHAAAAEELARCRCGVVHNDANDYNVLCVGGQVSSIIDFGDAVYTQVVNDVAISMAYALMGKEDPVQAGQAFLRGYHAAYPLTEAELSVLHTLVLARLAVSVTKCASAMKADPGNAEYLAVSNAPAWGLITQLLALDPKAVDQAYRAACHDVDVCKRVKRVLREHADEVQRAPASDVPTSGKTLFPAPGRVYVRPRGHCRAADTHRL